MFRWTARLAVVLLGAALFTLGPTLAQAEPSRAPHANPTDIPPSTVVEHGIPVPLAVLGVLALALAVVAAVALARRRTT